jgi:hypothetical protein
VATRFFGAAAVAGNVVLAGGELELDPLVDVELVGVEDVVDVDVVVELDDVGAVDVVVEVDDAGDVDVVVELDDAGDVDVVVEVAAAPVA